MYDVFSFFNPPSIDSRCIPNLLIKSSDSSPTFMHSSSALRFKVSIAFWMASKSTDPPSPLPSSVSSNLFAVAALFSDDIGSPMRCGLSYVHASSNSSEITSMEVADGWQFRGTAMATDSDYRLEELPADWWCMSPRNNRIMEQQTSASWCGDKQYQAGSRSLEEMQDHPTWNTTN